LLTTSIDDPTSQRHRGKPPGRHPASVADRVRLPRREGLRRQAINDQHFILKDGKLVGHFMVDLRCLSDTIDPREPKGK
jgi:hypothetical protein